jgi:predicted nucleic-acid-binding protein
MKKYIVDTNFILRYLLADNKEQYKTAKTIFDQARDGRVQIELEQSVFVETIFVLSSFYKIPKNKIIEIMHSFLSYKGIETEKDLLHKALEIYQNHNIHIVDSIIAAKSLLDSFSILTFDKKLELILKK